MKTIVLFDTLNGNVSNCVALNSSVKATGSAKSIPHITTYSWEEDGLGFEKYRAWDSTFNSGGRIVGGSDAGKLSNNAAFSGITNKSGKTAWDKRNIADINGVDIPANVIKADGTLGGRFTNKNGWVTQNGKLPGFGVAVEMPTHLK